MTPVLVTVSSVGTSQGAEVSGVFVSLGQPLAFQYPLPFLPGLCAKSRKTSPSSAGIPQADLMHPMKGLCAVGIIE